MSQQSPVTVDPDGTLSFQGTKLRPDRSQFQLGEKVRIFGLKSKEEWNNRIGEIVGDLIESSFRWPVCLLDPVTNKRTKQIALLRHYNLLLYPAPYKVQIVPNHAKSSVTDEKDDEKKQSNDTDTDPSILRDGQGWIATRDIPSGSLIFTEKPLLIVNNKHKNTAEYIKEVNKVIRGVNYRIREEFNKLPNRNAIKKGTSLQDFERTFGLPVTPVSKETKEKEIFDRYLTNAIVLEYDGKEDGFEGRNFGRQHKSMKARLMSGDDDNSNKKLDYDKEALTRTQKNYNENTKDKSGIFTKMSLINHSCHANSRWFWSKNNNCEILITTRNINKGDEITCDYKSVNNKLYQVRKNELKKQIKFDCQCLWCRERERTDKIIKKFNKLYNKAFTTLNGAKNKPGAGGSLRLGDNISEETAKDVLRAEELLLNLIVNKMDCDTEYLWVILHSAATLCLMLGDPRKGCKYLDLSIKWFWYDRGVIAFEDYRDGLPQHSEIIRYIQSGFKEFEVYVKKKATKAIGPPKSKKKKKKQVKKMIKGVGDVGNEMSGDVSVKTNGNETKDVNEVKKVKEVKNVTGRYFGGTVVSNGNNNSNNSNNNVEMKTKMDSGAMEDEKLNENLTQAAKTN